jgi:predicted dehydrogenase
MSGEDAAPFTAAVVGCGWMGAEILDRPRPVLPPGWLPMGHAQAIRATPGLALLALCDSDRARLDRAGDSLGVAARYTDHRELLREARPDVVGVATRMPGRCRIIGDCIDAGVKAIHAEKPLGASLAECLTVLEPMRRRRIPFTFGTLRRFAGAYRRARAMVADGAIGTLRHITVEHGRDLLMWSHPHSVDLLLYFAGSFAVESAQATCAIPEGAVRGNVIDADPTLENAFVRFADGIAGAITSGSGYDTRLDGSEGRLSILADGARLVLERRESDRSPYLAPAEALAFEAAASPSARAFRELVDALRTGAPTATPPDAVEAGQRLLMAIALSAAEGGHPVRPSEVPQDFTVTSRFGDRTA